LYEASTTSVPESPLAGRAAVQWLLGVILVVAPLFRSGKPALAVLALELLAVCILVLLLWQPSKRVIGGWEALALALLFAAPLLYLLPLPASLAAWLPGRQVYLGAQSLIGSAATGDAARLSLYPLKTESALLLLLVPVAVFLGTRSLDADRIVRLVLLLLGVGAAQALLGLLQYGAGEGSPALFGLSFTGVRRAMGTYTNPDHLAGLLEMLLPMGLALLLFSVGRRRRDERRGWRDRVAFLSSVRGHVAVVYGAIALLLLLGVIFSRSRAGIALGMLGILLSTMMFSRRIGGDNVYGPTGTVVAFALGAGIAIGLVPVLDRFSVDAAVGDARWSIFSATLDGIGAFAPIGSGPGNYPDIFPAFQPLALGQWFINHAHNDYLEWLFEGGLFAAALMVLLFGLYVRQWLKVWTRDAWSRYRFVQVGAGIGILLLLLHSLVDFNLHIPANIAYFAFLAGVFFADPESESETEPVKRRRRRTPDLKASTATAPPSADAWPGTPPPDQIKNPFLDED
jgi:O-antigen ligase